VSVRSVLQQRRRVAGAEENVGGKARVFSVCRHVLVWSVAKRASSGV